MLFWDAGKGKGSKAPEAPSPASPLPRPLHPCLQVNSAPAQGREAPFSITLSCWGGETCFSLPTETVLTGVDETLHLPDASKALVEQLEFPDREGGWCFFFFLNQ